ncbi:hypothetical protein B0H14DRAFT_3147589 [Mycena olivaceomarginata]|nr:hypothetical protein B0H14DRAFT_3147589 [Mycena olivaceomarginata]
MRHRNMRRGDVDSSPTRIPPVQRKPQRRVVPDPARHSSTGAGAARGATSSNPSPPPPPPTPPCLDPRATQRPHTHAGSMAGSPLRGKRALIPRTRTRTRTGYWVGLGLTPPSLSPHHPPLPALHRRPANACSLSSALALTRAPVLRLLLHAQLPPRARGRRAIALTPNPDISDCPLTMMSFVKTLAFCTTTAQKQEQQHKTSMAFVPGEDSRMVLGCASNKSDFGQLTRMAETSFPGPSSPAGARGVEFGPIYWIVPSELPMHDAYRARLADWDWPHADGGALRISPILDLPPRYTDFGWTHGQWNLDRRHGLDGLARDGPHSATSFASLALRTDWRSRLFNRSVPAHPEHFRLADKGQQGHNFK